MVGDSWFVRVSVRPQQVATSRFWLVRQNRSTTYGFRQPTGQTRTPGIRHFVCEIALRGNDLAHFYRDTWRALIRKLRTHAQGRLPIRGLFRRSRGTRGPTVWRRSRGDRPTGSLNYGKVTVSEVVAPSTLISTPDGKSVSVNTAMWSTTVAVLSGVELSPMYMDKVLPSLV